MLNVSIYDTLAEVKSQNKNNMNPQNQSPAGPNPPQNSSGSYNAPGADSFNNDLAALGVPPGSIPPTTPVPGVPSNAQAQPPLMPEPLKPLGSSSAPDGPSSTREQVLSKLRESNNVLVTVSSNPSVDQLAAAIGFTIVLNKLGKHATAVFSGEIPSTIEFLQPEKTLEKTTDSLRDFIIALDKSKADKLRYKIEDKFVKIFITPYHTSLSEKDLEFSQGDFNVDAVVALGVQQKEQLDQAITAHGRILHDATVISINNTDKPTDIGVINWQIPEASSLSEIMVGVSEVLQSDKKIVDGQIATAFLTGIVAETSRFSNDKTSPVTMNTAAKLMSVGANQQLVATKLAEPKPEPKTKKAIEEKKTDKTPEKPKIGPPPKVVKSGDGSLQVPHPGESAPAAKTIDDLQKMVEESTEEDDVDKIHIDDEGTLRRLEELKEEEERKKREGGGRESGSQANGASNSSVSSSSGSSMAMTPPTLGGALSSNTRAAGLEPSSDALSLPPVQDGPLLKHGAAGVIEQAKDESLADLEQSVGSPHANGHAIDTARQAVSDIPTAERPEPIAALNAQPLGLDLHRGEGTDLPPQLIGPDKGLPPDETASAGPPKGPPPPVPPPMVPPSTGGSSTNPL